MTHHDLGAEAGGASLAARVSANEQPRAWFITGTSSGIGRELTRALLDRGDRVAATAPDVRALKDIAPDAEERLWVTELDVTNLEQIHNAVDKAFAAFGRIDIVVNNAGYGLVGAIEEMTDEQVRHQLDTNLLGAIRVTKAFLPRFRAQGSGHIVQISSSGGQRTAPGLSLYHATKWGLEAFSEGLALEIVAFGIKVTIAEPGGCRTNWRANAVKTRPIPEYDQTPVGDYRRSDPVSLAPGDPVKMARAIIDAVDRANPPRRLVMGSDAFQLIHTALRSRLAEVEAQETTAPLTDADDTRPSNPVPAMR